MRFNEFKEKQLPKLGQPPLTFTSPQFDVEWEEANRYPYLAKLGEQGWIDLANTGREVHVTRRDISRIGNTDAADYNAWEELEKEKRDRFNTAIESGSIEMPIVMKRPDGKLELIAGNTRLTGILEKYSKATVWFIDASELQESTVAEGVNDPGIFKAVFIVGGPGSGKSFIAKKSLQGHGFRIVNSDDVFEYLMVKNNLDLKMQNLSPDELVQRDFERDKAKKLTAKRQWQYIHGRLGLIIDGTGRDFERAQKLHGKLFAIGYEMKMIFVNTDLKAALQRNEKRARTVKRGIVKKSWDSVQRNMGKFQDLFGRENFYLVDNSSNWNTEKDNWLTQNVWQPINAWSGQLPNNPSAKEWIASQRA